MVTVSGLRPAGTTTRSGLFAGGGRFHEVFAKQPFVREPEPVVIGADFCGEGIKR